MSSAHLSMIDALAAQHFSSEESASGDVSSGPGYFLIDLLTSKMLWDDDGTRAREVEEQYTAELVGLEAALTARWGPPGGTST